MSRICGLCFTVIVCVLASRGGAQLFTVTTPGLTPPQCVKSSGTSTIVNAGTCVTTPGLTPPQCVKSNGADSIMDAGACPGRTAIISAAGGSSIVLSNSDCGAVVKFTSTL